MKVQVLTKYEQGQVQVCHVYDGDIRRRLLKDLGLLSEDATFLAEQFAEGATICPMDGAVYQLHTLEVETLGE